MVTKKKVTFTHPLILDFTIERVRENVLKAIWYMSGVGERREKGGWCMWCTHLLIGKYRNTTYTKNNI